jgi:hypothetical protein
MVDGDRVDDVVVVCVKESTTVSVFIVNDVEALAFRVMVPLAETSAVTLPVLDMDGVRVVVPDASLEMVALIERDRVFVNVMVDPTVNDTVELRDTERVCEAVAVIVIVPLLDLVQVAPDCVRVMVSDALLDDERDVVCSTLVLDEAESLLFSGDSVADDSVADSVREAVTAQP